MTCGHLYQSAADIQYGFMNESRIKSGFNLDLAPI